MKSSALKAVIFDCDGILVDTEPLHYRAFQEALRPLGMGYDYAHYLERYIGFDDRDAFLEAFREAGREIDSEGLKGLIETKAEALRDVIAGGISSFPGVLELVRDLIAGGVPLAVASGALKGEVDAFVESLGLEGAFSVVVAAEDVKRSKPDPETYLLAVEGLRTALDIPDLGAEDCIAIEDTPAGIQSAKAAGLHVIGVTNSFSHEPLREADLVTSSLAEFDCAGLIQFIERLKSRR